MIKLVRSQLSNRLLGNGAKNALPPPEARGPDYIVPSSESEPSDQTDINRTVFLDPLGRWSMIREVERDCPKHQGGRPRGEGGRPVPEPARLPVRSHGF